MTRPRGPLPRRVYWFRRALVLGLALVLVVGIAKILDYSTGGSGKEQATAVSAPESPSPTASSSGHAKRLTKAQKAARRAERDKLAQPSGPCDDSDVLVTPTITDAHAGSPVKIVLEVTTAKSPACFWQVKPDSVFVNILDDEGTTLWSSQQCPNALPTKTIVPRRDKAAKVHLWWTGKESDETCSSWTDWVLPGSYTAVAAAKGSITPVDNGFVLGNAVAPTVTETPTPTKTPKGKNGGHREKQGTESPSGSPGPSPSGSPTESPSPSRSSSPSPSGSPSESPRGSGHR